jgi:hypothetical protein
MALRRPPTRLELKTEDMMEYEEARERMSSSTVATSTFLNINSSVRRTATLPSTHERIGLHRNNNEMGGNPNSNRSRNPHLHPQSTSMASSR